MKILKKSSFQELLHQMGQYLAWNIPRTGNSSVYNLFALIGRKAPFTHSLTRTGRFKFVQIKSPGHKWPRPKGT